MLCVKSQIVLPKKNYKTTLITEHGSTDYFSCMSVTPS